MKQIASFWILIFFLCTHFSFGQNDTIPVLENQISTDSIVAPMAKTKAKKKKGNRIKRFFKADYPSPRKAVILTAILPGLGQIYNKKHWYIKLPLIYGAFGGLIYSIDFNRSEYLFLKNEHKAMVDGLSSTTSIYEGRVTADVLKSARDQHDKWLQMSYIGIGLAYILTAAEAYTTAHLLSFDVGDDLSLQFKPSVDIALDGGTMLGFGVNLKLGKNKKQEIPKSFFFNGQ